MVHLLLSSIFLLGSFTSELFGDRLGTYGLAEYQIEGDGNCQVSFLYHVQNYLFICMK
jgi:hypothetical protein